MHLGCTKEEKLFTHLVSIDIDLFFHPIAVTTDRVEDTICYRKIVEHIQEYVQDKKFNLIEYLARSLHRSICVLIEKEGHSISDLHITVHKVNPPVPGIYGGVYFTYCGLEKKQ